MRVALTGASGSIGREFIRQFPETVPVSVRYRNRSQYDVLADKLMSVDALVCAGASLSSDSEIQLIDDNAFLPMDVLEIVHQVRGSSFPVILISSMSVLATWRCYKHPSDMSLYAWSKFLMEKMALRYVDKVAYKNIRFSTIFNRDPDKDGLSKMVYTAKREGAVQVYSCLRDFIPIDEAVRLLGEFTQQSVEKGIALDHPKGVDIGSGQPTNLLDVASYLNEKYNIDVKLMGELMTSVCYQFNSPKELGLTFDRVDILKEVGDYYDRIDLCNGS